MPLRRWKRTIASCTIMLSMALLLLGSAKAATSTAPPLPANYRELMARYVRTYNHYVILDAKITKPYERSRTVFLRDPVMAVCVVIFRKNMLGGVVRDNYVMTIDNGEVTGIPISFDHCTDLLPFPELKRP